MDKINIYVPRDVGAILENDAIQFEVLKKDGYTVNKNKFLRLLIQGYYDSYIEESHKMYDSIYVILKQEGLSREQCNILSNSILKSVCLPEIPTRKGKNPVKLSLKPTKEIEPLINQIMLDLGTNDYVSQFFCRMFMNYCEKPFSEREHIIFKENYNFISQACNKNHTIRFTTIWNPSVVHEVIPYKLAISKEAMFTYLLCGEKNKYTGVLEAKSYRLNRLTGLGYGKNNELLSEEVEKYLNKMILCGPQFAINDNEISCVKLTEEGRIYFNRIYYGRPKPDKILKVEDGWLFYFDCSKEQLYQYFKRFEKNRADVIEPQSLKLRIKYFHEEALTNKGDK